ncbi:MAG: lipoate--protein ligase family protein [Candidatus Omnitrophota bacterium]|nr:lipoate--protein ligase family protein [Candidatus Omnitrophota bacterium]
MDCLKNWRILMTGFNDASTNMAIDEAILKIYAQGAVVPTLRIYAWQPWAFSIGCFQDPERELDLDECRQFSVEFVRRMTGGGLVFHSRELTYSIVCSRQHFRCGSLIESSFKRICAFIIKTYQSLGLEPGFAVDQKRNKKGLGRKTAICFSGREKCDILVNNRKIGGNAQRRFRNVIFQHGFIPLELNLDFAAWFLKGREAGLKNNVISLSQALGRSIGFDELAFKLIDSFKKVNSLELVETDLSDEEKKLAEYLKKEKYSSPDWNIFRQNPGKGINANCFEEASLA